jgi:hypothetical protein
MFTPDHYRAKAAEYGALAKTANAPGEAREFRRRERSFTELADNEQWLADHHDRTVHAIDAGGTDELAPVLKDDAAETVAQ